MIPTTCFAMIFVKRSFCIGSNREMDLANALKVISMCMIPSLFHKINMTIALSFKA